MHHTHHWSQPHHLDPVTEDALPSSARHPLQPGAILPLASGMQCIPTVLLALTLGAGAAAHLQAQSPSPQPAQPAFSIGQPPLWRPYLAGFASHATSLWGGGALLGVAHPILNPISGILSAAGEAYTTRVVTGTDAGVRLLARIPFFGLGVGADWRATHRAVDVDLSFQTAIERGGVIGGGSLVRLDWLPGRDHTLTLGLQVPIMQPLAGRTRQRHTNVDIPIGALPARAANVPLPPGAGSALAALARTTTLIGAFTNLYSADNERALLGASRDPYAASYPAATNAYRAALVSAFSAVVRDSALGATLATRARAGVLDDAILPYDALFGQNKNDRGISGLLRVAHEDYARWLADSTSVPLAQRGAVLAVHARWLSLINDLCESLLHQWKDSRLVWLPLQLALSPDQYDDQAEVDTLIARAVGRPFTDHNAVAYLRTADLSLEIARSIAAARRYHVLWTHDFTGRLPSGKLDSVAYTMVADAYLPALTAAVQRYDTSGVMPQYVILVDAYYYNGRDARLWMTLLEDPLHARVKLRASEATQAAHLEARLSALRAAVAHSPRLQRDASAHGGSAWLARTIKVNVNVLQPSDFSFRSSRIVPPFPFTPDNIMRDHRKLALYDFTESHPYDGALLVTGIGVGEHYASATWEDRGFRVQGPAALEARHQVRVALEANGLSADRIPVSLRAAHDAAPADSAANAAHHQTRALEVHNEPGFAPKRASVARAMLYSLAPPGSVIIVPDPLWLSETWAAMLVGAAARGAEVMIVAPSLANDPNQQAPVLALQGVVVRRLFAIANEMAAQFRAAGGALRIGLYASRAPITDVTARTAEVRAGLAANPWIRQMIPFDSAALAVLNSANSAAAHTDVAATSIAGNQNGGIPMLHQKTVFIARPGAIAALVEQPGWDHTLAQTIRAQSRETGRLAASVGDAQAHGDSAGVQAADSLLQRYERALPAADRNRMSFYFTLGSQNHDPRGLMMDGEAAVIVSGFAASAGLVDLFYLMARTTWITHSADIDRLLPAKHGLMARIAHLVRFAM